MIGCVESSVPEPIAGQGHIDAGGDELDTDAVTAGVQRDALCRECRHVASSGLHVSLELEANPCRAKRLTISVDKNGFVMPARLSPQQRLEHVHRFWPEGANSTLAARPEQLDLSG
jgi:hypothetical protein